MTGAPVGTTCETNPAPPSALPNSGCDVQFTNTGSGDATVKAKDNPVTPLAGLQAAATAAGGNVNVTFKQGTQGISPQPLLQEQVDSNGNAVSTNELSTDQAGTNPGVTATYYNDTDFGADTPGNDNPVLATRTEKSITLGNVPSHEVIGTDPGDFVAPTRADNQWSVKWKGYFTAQSTGEYHFSLYGSGSTNFWMGTAGSDLSTVTHGKPTASVIHTDFGISDQAYENLVKGLTYPIEVDFSPADAAAGSAGAVITGNNVPANEPGGAAGTVTSIHSTSQGGGLGVGVILGESEPNTMLQDAVNAAASANEAVIFAGEQGGEGQDRQSLSLPGNQNQLISAVAAVQPNTIVVLNGPGAYTMPWLHQVKSVLDMFYPGATFGTAAADLIFGTVDPSGHLSETFPADESQGPGGTDKSDYPGLTSHQHADTHNPTDPLNMYDDYHPLAQETYGEGVDVGYRYWETHNQTPLFPFGFGLSYTTFNQQITGTHSDNNGNILLDVKVTNTGTRDGKAVVEGYVGDPASTGEPPLQLRAFTKVNVPAGQSANVTLGFAPRAFAYWNDAGTDKYSQGDWRVDAGTYSLNLATDAEASDIVDHVNVTLPAMDLNPTSFANDVAAPVASASLSPAPSGGVYTTTPTVTLTATSPTDGDTVGSIEYNLDDAGWTTYSSLFQITGDGTHQLQYRVIDQYGTTGGTDSQSVVIHTTSGGSGGGSTGGTGGTGGGQTVTPCRQTRTPISHVHNKRLVAKRLHLAGSASSRGCGKLLSVRVALARTVGKKCRFLQSNGKFGRLTACRPTVYLRATGTTTWTFSRAVKLSPGVYHLWVQALNPGNLVETKSARKYIYLRVPKK